MSFSNSVFVLCLLTAQELIASFSMNTYRVSGPNFARRCVGEGRCHKCENRQIASCMLFWPVLKNYILWGHIDVHVCISGVFMFVQVYMCVCTGAYICLNRCICMYVCASMYVCMDKGVWIYILICVFQGLYTYISM